MDTHNKALLCLKIIRERKAIDPVLIDVGKLSSVTDYFLIASGNSNRQVQAIGRHLTRRLREEGIKVFGTEGEKEGHWLLLDYGDVIIHLFYEPVREFYDLESLWIEGDRILPDENNISNSQ